MNMEEIDLSTASKETLELLIMILNLKQLDITNEKFKEELRLMRERDLLERQRYEQEREEAKARYEQEREEAKARYEQEREEAKARYEQEREETRKRYEQESERYRQEREETRTRHEQERERYRQEREEAKARYEQEREEAKRRSDAELLKWCAETRKYNFEGLLYPFIAGATIMGAFAALLNYLKP